jgi:PAS domain S-box-containing protein
MSQIKTNGLSRPDLDYLLEGCQIIGFDWSYVYLNKTAEYHNRIPNEQLLGEKYEDMWPGIEKTEVYRLIKDCLENRNAHRLENEFVFPSGNIGWFELSIQPVPEGVFILSIDITKAKEVSMELLLQKEHFQHLFEQATDGIFIADEKGNYSDVNLAGCCMLGYSREEIIHMKIHDIITPDEYDRVEPSILELHNKRTTRANWKFQRKDKTVFVGEVTSKLLPSGHLQAYLRDITALQMSEIALLESERKFKTLVADMQVGVLIQGPGSEILLSNPKALELLGFSEEQLLGKTSFDPDWNVIHEDGSPFPGPTHPVAVSISERVSVRDVIMGIYRPAFGDRMWVLVDASPQLNDDGSIRHVICTFIDINKRKEAEAALRKSEDLFNKAFHGSPSPMTIANQKDGRYIAVNDSFLRLVGLPREKVIGQTGNMLNLIDDDARSKIRSVLKQKGSLHDIEIPARSQNGKQLYLLASVENTNLAGEPCTIATMLDITERKLAEEALIQSETKFRKIYEEGPFGMALVNSEFKYINCNTTFCQIIGYSEQELKSRTFKDISYKIDENETRAILSLIKGEIPVYKHEKQYVRKDGKVIWGALTVTANFSHDGHFLYNLAIVEDISARKHAEEELLLNKAILDSSMVKIKELNETLELRVEERTAQLRAANRELEAFSYSVSHDLRAPLRGINGFTQILMDEYEPNLDKEGKRICSIIQENSQRMGRLIDELLAFSRLNRSEMMFTAINMKELINVAFRELTDSEQVSNIEFNQGDILDSHGDPTMIKQVWINLLQNAIKYSSRNERIIIGVSSVKEDGFVVYCVKDHGVGFSMEFSDKLFGVFQRLHSTTEFEGTGVGLAIVQRIVLRHGGAVWAKGEIGQGAEFYFSLPDK